MAGSFLSGETPPAAAHRARPPTCPQQVRTERFRWTRFVSPVWEFTMNLIFGMAVSLMLMAGGVWANVDHSGPLSHSQGAWVSR
jgi:hypothetical protein